MTVDEAYRKWQNEYWFDSRNILEKTINGYISMFDRHIIPIIGKEDISSIDCTKIQKHYDELSENGYSAKTIRNIHQALSSLLSWCFKKGFLEFPIHLNQLVTYPKPAKKLCIQNVPTISEYTKLVGVLSGHYKYAIQFMAHTGIRFSELSILKENIDFEHGFVRISSYVQRIYTDYKAKTTQLTVQDYPKTSSAHRVIRITPNIEKILLAQLSMLDEMQIKSEYIFCNRHGGVIEERNIIRYYKSALEKAGLNRKGIYSLRKLYIYTGGNLNVT